VKEEGLSHDNRESASRALCSCANVTQRMRRARMENKETGKTTYCAKNTKSGDMTLPYIPGTSLPIVTDNHPYV